MPDMMGAEYQAKQVGFERTDKYRAEVTELIARMRAGARSIERGWWLDIGCGPGFGAGLMQSMLDDPVVAMDPSVDATMHWSGTPNVCFARADGRHLPVQDRSFESAVFLHSLGHVEDEAATLRRALQALKPGGALGIVTPNARFIRWMRPLNLLGIVKHKTDETVIRFYSETTLRTALAAAGFTDVEIIATGARPHLLKAVRIGNRVRERLIAVARAPKERGNP